MKIIFQSIVGYTLVVAMWLGLTLAGIEAVRAESFCAANCVSARAGNGLRLDSTGALELDGDETVIINGATLSGVTSGMVYVANNTGGPMSFTLPSVDHAVQKLDFCIGAASNNPANEITMNRNDADVISYDASVPVTAYTFFGLGKGAVNICLRLTDGNNLGGGDIGFWMVRAVSTQKTTPSTLHAWFTTVTDDGNCATSDTIDFSQATGTKTHKSTLTGDCTYTFTDPGFAATLKLKVCQDGTGGHTVTWDGDVKWPSGTAPTITAGGGQCDTFIFTSDDGLAYEGAVYGQNYTP